jgi:hypothetical protein
VRLLAGPEGVDLREPGGAVDDGWKGRRVAHVFAPVVLEAAVDETSPHGRRFGHGSCRRRSTASDRIAAPLRARLAALA